MDLIEEARMELAGKIEHLRATGNLLDQFTLSEMQRGHIMTNFPKNLPPKGIAYSKNFQLSQKGGIFAVQTK